MLSLKSPLRCIKKRKAGGIYKCNREWNLSANLLNNNLADYSKCNSTSQLNKKTKTPHIMKQPGEAINFLYIRSIII